MTTTDLLAMPTQQLEKKDNNLERAVEAITRQQMASKEQFERSFVHQLAKTGLSGG
jgi:hypothetical protein